MAERGRERGAALLTVLLLVAVIAVIAATALERLRVSTRLAANAGTIDQARGFAFAAETLATQRVTTLLGSSPDRVALVGGWSDRPYALPVPGGLATARVRDGGNCFNLNGLVSGTAEGGYAAFTPQVAQFARLIRAIGVAAPAESIAAAAADWIDSDDAAIASGAEDADYTGYRTAGTLMADPSELRAVAGVTPEIYAALRPWLCTLPQASPTTINVNTLAPERAALVAALSTSGLSVAAVRAALLRRPDTGFADTAAFWAQIASPGADQAQTAVISRWFDLHVDVRLGTTAIEEHGLIDATALPARLVSRQWGEEA